MYFVTRLFFESRYEKLFCEKTFIEVKRSRLKFDTLKKWKTSYIFMRKWFFLTSNSWSRNGSTQIDIYFLMDLSEKLSSIKSSSFTRMKLLSTAEMPYISKLDKTIQWVSFYYAASLSRDTRKVRGAKRLQNRFGAKLGTREV